MNQNISWEIRLRKEKTQKNKGNYEIEKDLHK